ncbi:ribosomal protein L13e [Coccomyxa subellipsoidea C-169]|uniref:60S ribosomal protein L13 n=1 Tax=Coccomyxa subellipsoidea (strain C-169) TaxID=574566 RepID=I0YU71_COCSC|nr:ribosomal protein L13e [Coccomyxa subellipsoidea C-169]EIE21940.1 ribosomal protein L13e [Coccomyxa subellipsoidea C-169]|eukprot:XP_005646484.1 ribosomal protein L13e [Coccomyxa subellipsoidea C-169]
MVKHNNVIPNQHFKKHWHGGKNGKGSYVRTWFNQPARKHRRATARIEKAKKVFPRPAAGPLRPIVHGQTIKYNLKKRLGRGFTLEELKEAGIAVKLAPTIGIAVDHRRHNRSLESLQENAARLKAYKAKLVIFPTRSNMPKSGDSTAEELKVAQQHKGPLLPLVHAAHKLESVKLTDELKAEKAYYKLRLERTNAKLVGVRAKRAAEAAAEEKDRAK